MKLKRKANAIVPQPARLGMEQYQQKHEIVVSSECPAPFESFDAAEDDFGGPLTKVMRRQGFKAPMPIQAQAWPVALQGRDIVAVAKAGSGKTCGFLLPALARLQYQAPRPPTSHDEPARPSILIICPTRELAIQIAGEAKKFAAVARARIATLYGGVPKHDQVMELKDGVDLVVATPGRLIDFSEGSKLKDRRPIIAFTSVTYLVLDEADRMLDLGFGGEMNRIIAQCPPIGRPEEGGGAAGPKAGTKRQTLFFTATWPDDVQKTAEALTSRDAVQVTIGSCFVGERLTANTDVTQTVLVIPKKDKLKTLVHLLDAELLTGETAIVFVKRRSTCEMLEFKLFDERENKSIGTWCRGIHAGKDQWTREENLSTFRELTTSGDARRGVLIATDVAARGLDIPGVAIVIVYDFSGGSSTSAAGAISYVHRIGRTGRAGKSGKAFTLFTEQDAEGAAHFIRVLENTQQHVPSQLRELAELPPRQADDSEGCRNLQKVGTPQRIPVSNSVVKSVVKSEKSPWIQRLERRILFGLGSEGVSKRATKRARQKAARSGEDKKQTKAGHTFPKAGALKKRRKSDAGATLAQASTDAAIDAGKKKCRHKRHRVAAKAAQAVDATGSPSQSTSAPTHALGKRPLEMKPEKTNKRHRRDAVPS